MTASTSDVLIEVCDPRERSAEIHDLFARNGKPDFDRAYRRAYLPRIEHGLRSWVGQVEGRAVMHISVNPTRFTDGTRTLTAGVMGDLMVEEEFRDFWTPARLLRTVAADLKREGQVDFLITTTTNDAETVFKAGGFREYGDLRRYVLPLNRAFLAFTRLRRLLPRLDYEVTAEAPIGPPSDPPMKSGSWWRPEASDEHYRTHVPRAEYEDLTWLALYRKGESEPVARAAMSRRKSINEMVLADALWVEGKTTLAAIAIAAARWARKQGFPKLAVSTMAEAVVAAELRETGFFDRSLRSVMLVNRLREIPPVEELYLTGFALSDW